MRVIRLILPLLFLICLGFFIYKSVVDACTIKASEVPPCRSSWEVNRGLEETQYKGAIVNANMPDCETQRIMARKRILEAKCPLYRVPLVSGLFVK